MKGLKSWLGVLIQMTTDNGDVEVAMFRLGTSVLRNGYGLETANNG